MHKAINEYIENKIKDRKNKDAFRSFKVNESLVDFCSNDYLGFARNTDLLEASKTMLEATVGNVNGSTGARTITGTTKLITALENQIASFHGSDAALIYNSGYAANLGLFSSLPYRGDTIVYDELIHASIRDGMTMSRANAYSFKHNDLNALEKKLKLAKGNIYVAVESIYSMDGDMAPLKEIAELCLKYDAALIVDEAHSNGLYGENGEGLVSELGLQDKVFARVMTFGKALGCHGAAVVGSQNLKDFLINYSRSFIYTTAPAPHQVISIKNAYDILSINSDNRLKLSDLIKSFKESIKSHKHLVLIDSISPIQCLIVPGNKEVKVLCEAIQGDGFDVRPIVAPTVPVGKERIRICFHAFNSTEEVEGLVNSILKHYPK